MESLFLTTPSSNLLIPHSPLPFSLHSHPPPIPSLANTSKGAVFQQGNPRLTDVLHFLLSEKEGLALPHLLLLFKVLIYCPWLFIGQGDL